MKKRMLSMLLMLCMVISLLPGTAFAAEGDTAETPDQEQCAHLLGCGEEVHDVDCPLYADSEEIPTKEPAEGVIENEQSTSISEPSGQETPEAEDGKPEPYAGNSAVFWNPTSGNDSNTGESKEQAVKTLNKAKELLQEKRLALIYLTSVYAVTGNENWDLGGATIQRYETGGMMIELVDSNASLTLSNVVLDGKRAGEPDPTLQGYEPIIKALNGGTVVLNNGTVLKNNESNLGGAGVYGRRGFSLTMNEGAVIQDNATHGMSFGGGVMIGDEGSSFTMNGGMITGNTGGRGGGVAIVAAQMTMNGGTISHNTTYGAIYNSIDGYGGGIYIADYQGITSVQGTNVDFGPAEASFTMTGGSITQNTGISYGGGIATFPQGEPQKDITININGGEISQNKVMHNGRGGGIAIFFDASKLHMNNGVIKNNEAFYGGGVYLYQAGNQGNVEFSGGSISGNTTSYAGSGLCLDQGSKATISGTEIANNTASTSGGGVYIGTNSTLTMTDGEISNNIATKNGGGVFINPNATYELTGGTVTGNNQGDASLQKGGDGVLVSNQGSFKVGANGKVSPDNDVYLKTGAYVEVISPYTGANGMSPIHITSEEAKVEAGTSIGTKLVLYTENAGGQEAAKKADISCLYLPSAKMSPDLMIGQSTVENTWMTYIALPEEVLWYYNIYIQKADGTYPDNPSLHGQGGWASPNDKVSISAADFDGKTVETYTLGQEIVYDASYKGERLSADRAQNAGKYNPLKIYYKRAPHTVTYQYDGATPSNAPALPETVNTWFGTEVSVAAVPTVDGWVFSGWTVKLPEGTTIQDGKLTMPNADVVLSGSWRKTGGGGNTGSDTAYYILHYESNGGTKYKDERYAKNTVVQLDKVPVREGYQFTGWYADKELTERITSIKMTSDKTVYAGWRKATVPDMLNGDDHFAYVIGYTDGTVRPNANISRSEVAAIFFRLLKPEVRDGNLTSFNTFTDVNEGMWCNKSISTMAALNIVKGRSAERFDPDAPITRAEFAAICARFDTGMTEGDSNFTDISGHWAEAEIERAASLGWIMGYTDGTFRPDNYITRAEAMTMINRVLCRIPEDEDDLLPGMNVWPDNQPGAWYYLAVQEATNSHDFRYKGEIYEHWIKLTTDPDWTRYQD